MWYHVYIIYIYILYIYIYYIYICIYIYILYIYMYIYIYYSCIHTERSKQIIHIELCLFQRFQRHAHLFGVLRYFHTKFHTPIGTLVLSRRIFFSQFCQIFVIIYHDCYLNMLSRLSFKYGNGSRMSVKNAVGLLE